MAEVFNCAGIASVAVDGSTDDADRAAALKRLAAREINCIFAVDLLNEGLDLPQVDTIPPGRGQGGADRSGLQRTATARVPLRPALPGAHPLRAQGTVKAVEDEFPHLPSGSQIVLNRVAQKVVLDNMKAQLRFNRAQLVRDIASYAETELEAYVQRSGNCAAVRKRDQIDLSVHQGFVDRLPGPGLPHREILAAGDGP